MKQITYGVEEEEEQRRLIKKMRDYIKRVLIALIMALCVSLLFLGGKHSEASMKDEKAIKDGWIWPTDGIISDTYGTRMGKH